MDEYIRYSVFSQIHYSVQLCSVIFIIILVVEVVVEDVADVIVDWKNLALKFGKNRDRNSWDIVVVYDVVFVIFFAVVVNVVVIVEGYL